MLPDIVTQQLNILMITALVVILIFPRGKCGKP
jgi:hypothetical protein